MQVTWTFLINGLENIIRLHHIRLIFNFIEFILDEVSYIITYYLVRGIKYILDSPDNTTGAPLVIKIESGIDFHKLVKKILTSILVLDGLCFVEFQFPHIWQKVFVPHFHELETTFFYVLPIMDVHVGKNLKHNIQKVGLHICG